MIGGTRAVASALVTYHLSLVTCLSRRSAEVARQVGKDSARELTLFAPVISVIRPLLWSSFPLTHFVTRELQTHSDGIDEIVGY
jgi:hypothetical protein